MPHWIVDGLLPLIKAYGILFFAKIAERASKVMCTLAQFLTALKQQQSS